jgi:hypothetical protein
MPGQAPQQPQPQSTQQPQGQEQVQASQQNQQGLQMAAQLGAEIQRAGLSVGTFVQVVSLLQKHGPQLVSLFTDLQTLFGGSSGAPASGGSPEGQAAPR